MYQIPLGDHSPAWMTDGEFRDETAKRRRRANDGKNDQVEYCPDCGGSISPIEARIVCRYDGLLDIHRHIGCYFGPEVTAAIAEAQIAEE